ncbi:MAG: ATP-binding protein [Bacteroidota bacterium]
MNATQIVDFLQTTEVLKNVPRHQLEWFEQKGKCQMIRKGEFAFQKDDPIVHLVIILNGNLRLFIEQNGSQRLFGNLKTGDITGVLPFSRLEKAQGFADALEDTKIFRFPKECLPDMVQKHYELTEAFVHFMASRIRSFTRDQQQADKLMSLGRLSAGLMHELNNPASAIVRSANALRTHLTALPEDFKSVMQIQLPEAEIDAINNLVFSKIKSCDHGSLTLSERNDLEDDIATWLEDQGMEDGYDMAENLIEFGFELEDLEFIEQTLRKSDVLPVLKWVNQNLLTERTVVEIGESADRIEGIVRSVKSYTHMDQGHSIQAVNVHEGIKNTLTMLQHKFKDAGVSIEKQFTDKPFCFEGHPGEINQVWTNILDNAIDASREQADPKVTIHTQADEKGLTVEITDNGKGIPEEIIGKIFDPFFTTKKIGEGTGLGLDVVNQIVREHNGTINVTSVPGQTTFSLCFPIKE